MNVRPKQFAQQGFLHTNDTMRADFQAAITPDASVVVEADSFDAVANGFDRAVFPAFAAQFACLVVHLWFLDHMSAHETVQHFRPHGYGDYVRKDKIFQHVKAAFQVDMVRQQPQFPGCPVGMEHVRVQSQYLAEGHIQRIGVSASGNQNIDNIVDKHFYEIGNHKWR